MRDDFDCHSRAAPLRCERSDRRLDSYRAIVQEFIRVWRSRAEREREFYHTCSSLRRAIEYAALSMLPSGKRHSHQYRIPKTVLASAERALQARAAELRCSRSFDELHAAVEASIGAIPGIGALTVYDVASRMGAHLDLEPESVYLHAGTAVGAKALGLNLRRAALDPVELPRAFQRLRPSEVEDCLCLYKEELAAIAAKQCTAPELHRRAVVLRA